MKVLSVLFLILYSVLVSCAEVDIKRDEALVEYGINKYFTEFRNSEESMAMAKSDTLPEPFLKIRNRAHPRTSEYIGLEFRDERTGELITSIDRDSLNPFAYLPYPASTQSGYFGTTEYDLRRVSRDELVRRFGDWTTPSFLQDTIVTAASTMAQSVNPPSAQQYVAMTFQLYLTSSSGQVIAIIDRYYIFNDRGEVISIIHNNQGGYLGAIVSQDGKWLAIKTGVTFDENHALPERLLFFDIKDVVLKYCDSISFERNFYYFPIHDYFVCIEEIGGPDHASLFSFYKCEEGTKYTKVFDLGANGRPGVIVLDDYDTDGVYRSIYRFEDKKYQRGYFRIKTLFNNEFEVINLNTCAQ